jgi:hypothetical protein
MRVLHEEDMSRNELKRAPLPSRYRDEDLCEIYGVSRITIWRWRAKKLLKSFQVTKGGPHFTTPEALADLEKALAEESV